MEWLENYFVTRPENLELYKIFQHFTTARAYLVLENEQEALYYIHKLKKLGEDFQRPFDRITSYNVCYTKLLRTPDDCIRFCLC